MITLMPLETNNPLLADVRQLIGASRQRVASAVNAGLTQLYWQIGNRVNVDLLQGKSILSTVRRTLTWSHITALNYIDDPLKRDFYNKGVEFDTFTEQACELLNGLTRRQCA